MESEHTKKYGRSGVKLNISAFSKENIKDTHITAIEHLVSQLNVSNFVYRKLPVLRPKKSKHLLKRKLI